MASKEYREANKVKIVESSRQYYLKNKEKIDRQNKLYYENNKERVLKQNRNNELKRRFGITLEQKEELEKKQNYCCAICGKPEAVVESRTNSTRKLAVDHNHITGALRELLCFKCNTSLEHYEKYEVQYKVYLERHK